MKKFIKKILDNTWVKLLFSISIIVSSVPSIIQDFQDQSTMVTHIMDYLSLG